MIPHSHERGRGLLAGLAAALALATAARTQEAGRPATLASVLEASRPSDWRPLDAVRPAGRVELCNVPIPVRPAPGG